MARKKTDKPAEETTPSTGDSVADRHKNTTVTFRPPGQLLERLRTLAKKDKRSVAKLIEVLLEEALDARDQEGGAG